MKIELDTAAVEWLDAHARDKGFTTGAQYAGKLLQALVDALKTQNPRIDGLTTEEEKLIEERLRSLGYIE